MAEAANPTSVTLAQQLESELLTVPDIDRVVRVSVFEIAGGTQIVAAKVSLPAELTMQHVSAVLLTAERRVRALMPEVTHVFLTPDVYFDDTAAPSTSTIVTLSYD